MALNEKWWAERGNWIIGPKTQKWINAEGRLWCKHCNSKASEAECSNRRRIELVIFHQFSGVLMIECFARLIDRQWTAWMAQGGERSNDWSKTRSLSTLGMQSSVRDADTISCVQHLMMLLIKSTIWELIIYSPSDCRSVLCQFNMSLLII